MRLGFGWIRGGGRIQPVPSTRQVILFLEKLARERAVDVKGLERLYSDGELADHFGVDERTVRRWAQRRWIGYVDVGDGSKELRRYPATQIEQFIQRRYRPPDTSNASSLPA